MRRGRKDEVKEKCHAPGGIRTINHWNLCARVPLPLRQLAVVDLVNVRFVPERFDRPQPDDEDQPPRLELPLREQPHPLRRSPA